MAVRAFRLSVVFTIGFCLGPVALSTVATNVTDAPVPLSIKLEDPKDVFIPRGQPATLKCPYSTTARKSSLRWLCNNTLIPNNDTRRVLQKDGSLYIQKVAGRRYNTTEGSYRCLVSNEFGSILSNPASLKIAAFGHDFNEQPEDTKIVQDQPIVLRCQIHSTPAATILWERNNLSLPHSTRYVPLPTGALLITSTNSSDTGLYRCKATNNILNKTKFSKSAQLTVLQNSKNPEYPQFLPLGDAHNITGLVGKNLTMYCIASGWPLPSITWRNNSNGLTIGNTSMLTLHKISADMEGNYTCLASNSVGQITKNYILTVQQKPYFTVTPLSKSYPSAKTVRLDCQAKGIPEPEIHWLKNGVLLDMQARFRKQPSGLVLSHSFTTDAGIYQCVAVSPLGTIWAAAQLVAAPSTAPIPGPPQNVTCRPYDDTSICLQWTAPPNVSVQAYSVYSFYAGLGPEFVTDKTYQLANGLNRSTNYTFYVRVYSKAASDSSKEVSCETGAKGARNLQVTVLNNNSVNLTWSEMSSDIPCNGILPLYKLQWRKAYQSSVNVVHVETFSYIVTGLKPSTQYEFRVQPRTIKDDNSSWVSFLFPYVENVGGFPENNSDNSSVPHITKTDSLKVEFLTPTSVNLTWLDSSKGDFYTVCYFDVNTQDDCEDENKLQSKTKYMVIKNLKFSTLYEFKVRTHDNSGIVNPFAHSVQISTPEKVPPPPVENLNYTVINSSTVCIMWNAPKNNKDKIINYVLRYTPDRNLLLESWRSVTVDGPSKSKTCKMDNPELISVALKDLQPSQNYTVVVRPVTEAGVSDKPMLIVITTDQVNEGSGTYQKQTLGIILGLLMALICIICCVSCLVFKQRCIKRRSLARTNRATSNNFYPPSLATSHGIPIPVAVDESCAAEAHEMQQLMSEEGATHIPPVMPTHLDTKGSATYPNGKLNGSVKRIQNGYIANGHVHITENPQFLMQECSEQDDVQLSPHRTSSSTPNQEDSNSNIHSCKIQDLRTLNESRPVGSDRSDSQSTNNKCAGNLLSCKPKNKIKFRSKNGYVDDVYYSHDVHNCSLGSESDNSLNCTQLTCLDDSLTQSHRKIPPALGPNG